VTHVIVTWMKQDASFFPRVIFQFEMTASDNYFRQATRLAWYWHETDDNCVHVYGTGPIYKI